MSIWDNMKRSEPSKKKKNAQGMFTINFSTESVEIPAGTSLRDALLKNAAYLGYDGSRVVTWRDTRGVVAENTKGEAGQVFTAAVSLETKG
jgi:hypothetical protein